MIGVWLSALALAVGIRAPIDSATTDYVIGGVHVIQRRTSANDVVAVDLYLLGGTQQLTATTAGIEALALRAAEYGTDHYPRERGNGPGRGRAACSLWSRVATGPSWGSEASSNSSTPPGRCSRIA